MRLDKYLKVSRLVKRRAVAKEVCDAGRIAVNSRPAKAASEVHEGDTITIRYGNKTTEVKVVSVTENARKEAARAMYEVLSDSAQSENGANL